MKYSGYKRLRIKGKNDMIRKVLCLLASASGLDGPPVASQAAERLKSEDFRDKTPNQPQIKYDYLYRNIGARSAQERRDLGPLARIHPPYDILECRG